jgi:hypothetical protein
MSAIYTDNSIAKTNRFYFYNFVFMFSLVDLGLNAIILHVETVEVVGM